MSPGEVAHYTPREDLETLMAGIVSLQAAVEALVVDFAELMSSDLTYGNVVVGTSAVQIVASNSEREDVEIFNDDGLLTLYVGKDNAVTTVNGRPVYPKCSFGLDSYSGAVWGIASGAGCDVRYVELV